MWIYKPNNKQFADRKQIKNYVGGCNKLKKAIKENQILIIYDR